MANTEHDKDDGSGVGRPGNADRDSDNGDGPPNLKDLTYKGGVVVEMRTDDGLLTVSPGDVVSVSEDTFKALSGRSDFSVKRARASKPKTEMNE